MTKGRNSSYRITAYNQRTKLENRRPIIDTIEKAGDYKYYWFSSNASVANPQAYWEYVVAASLQGSNQDVDLFVSAIDARQPTSEDFDYKSDNYGADEVTLRSTDSFW